MTEDNYSEKRKVARFSISIPLQYAKFGVNKFVSSCTFDISANGLSLITSEELAPNAPLSICLKMPDNNQEIPLEVKVVWSKSVSPGQYMYGLRLINSALKPIELVLRTIQSRL